MTTNQTIDGLPRELLESFAAYVADSPNAIMRARAKELRALLDVPVKLDLVECDACPTSGGCVSACMKAPKPAAQPQSVPVEDCETFEYQLEILGSIDRCDVACGSYGDKFHRWDDAGPYVEYEDHVKHIELYKQEVERLSKLYAEQHAPVAVVMPEQKRADHCDESQDVKSYFEELGWNACLDEVTRLNSTRPTHASPPPGTEPYGTHHDNDGLDEWRKS